MAITAGFQRIRRTTGYLRNIRFAPAWENPRQNLPILRIQQSPSEIITDIPTTTRIQMQNSYCQRIQGWRTQNRITIPSGSYCHPASRYAAIDLGTEPPKLIATACIVVSNRTDCYVGLPDRAPTKIVQRFLRETRTVLLLARHPASFLFEATIQIKKPPLLSDPRGRTPLPHPRLQRVLRTHPARQKPASQSALLKTRQKT